MVSVVVPIYNTEKYIRQCIDTIMAQTYCDLQIILVDGDSPDGSKKICEEYAQKDPRITILSHANEGLSADRNVGIDMAKGEYITFIDGDDFISLKMIEDLLAVAKAEEADMVACEVIRCEENDCPDTITIPELIPKNEIYIGKEKMNFFMQDKRINTTAWAKLYKTEMFREIRYPVGKNHEDVYTTYKLVHIANKLCYINSVGYVYRKNMSGLSKGFSLTRLDSIRGCIERAQFIEKEYPALIGEAYSGIVYACNQCLMLMGKTQYYDENTLQWIQGLYRKYGKYYILSNKNSNLGKLATRVARVNVKFAWKLFRYFHKNDI